jgi:hypothetical protein
MICQQTSSQSDHLVKIFCNQRQEYRGRCILADAQYTNLYYFHTENCIVNWVDYYFLGRPPDMSGLTFISSPDMDHKKETWELNCRTRKYHYILQCTSRTFLKREKGKFEKWTKFWTGIN